MSDLLLHCGSVESTLDQIRAVPLPEVTSTWKPVPYGDAVEFLAETARTQLGMEIKQSSFGLNKEGQQLFARITLDAGDVAQGLSIGLRQSYNKSLALGVAVGTNVFVCDNLCFSGDAFKIVRKNTVNVWADFKQLVSSQVDVALASYKDTVAQTDVMRALPCHEQRGFALLGVALGRELMTPTQASVAFGDWRKPRYEEFADRNLWSLYNCVTEGLKKGGPGTVLDRHADAHGYFVEQLAA